MQQASTLLNSVLIKNVRQGLTYFWISPLGPRLTSNSWPNRYETGMKHLTQSTAVECMEQSGKHCTQSTAVECMEQSDEHRTQSTAVDCRVYGTVR